MISRKFWVKDHLSQIKITINICKTSSNKHNRVESKDQDPLQLLSHKIDLNILFDSRINMIIIQINMRKMIIMICLVTYYYSLQVHIELQIFFCANFCHYIQVFLSQILQMRIIRSLVSFNSIFIMNVINGTITKSQKDRLVEKALDFME